MSTSPAAMPAEGAGATSAPVAAPQGVPLVDAGVAAVAGQEALSTFLPRLRADLERMVDEELAGLPFTGRGCPIIQHYVGQFEARAAGEGVAFAARWIGPPAATTADELRARVVERARLGVRRWRQEGLVPAVPAGLTPPPRAVIQETLRRALGPAAAAAADLVGSGPSMFLKAAGPGARPASPARVLGELGPGTGLSGAARATMERAFAASFADVRVHADGPAAAIAARTGARAFAVGQHVGFAAGEYHPDDPLGRALLAHELAHTLQQREASGPAPRAGLERDADRSAAAALLGAPGAAHPRASGPLRVSGCSTDYGPPLDDLDPTALDEPASAEVAAGAAPAAEDPRERQLAPRWHGEGSFTLLSDVDGDGLPEVRLTFSGAASAGGPEHLDALRVGMVATRGEVDADAAASLDVRGLLFTGGFFPMVERVAEGPDSLRVKLDVPGTILLTIGRPVADETTLTYTLTARHTQSAAAPATQVVTLRLPREAVPRPESIRPEGNVEGVGDARYFDARVGPFEDRFRFTFVPVAPLSVRIGIAPLTAAGAPAGGTSMEGFHSREVSALQATVLPSVDLGLPIDLDGDGRADVVIYHRMTGVGGGPGDASNRHHDFYAHWPGTEMGRAGAGGNLRSAGFTIEGGAIQTPARRAYDMEAVSAAVAADAPELRQGPTTRAEFLQALNLQRDTIRDAAIRDHAVPVAVGEAFVALEGAFVALLAAMAPPEGGEAAADRTGPRATAHTAAEAFDRAFGPIAATFEEHSSGWDESRTFSNPVSGEAGTELIATSSDPYAEPEVLYRFTTTVARSTALVSALGEATSAGDDRALAAYVGLVRGFDTYVATVVDADTAARMRGVLALDAAVGSVPQQARPVRAVFHFEANLGRGRVQDSPVFLFYWKAGTTWHLKNVTNPAATREVTGTAADGETYPPSTLFDALNDRDIFPAGMLWWSIPGGPAGHVRCTEPWEVEDILNWFGTALVIAGVGLLVVGSGGTALPVVGGYLVAAGSFVGAGAAVASMVDRAGDGDWDATGWTLDSLQLLGGITGGLGAAKAVSLGAGMRAAGAPAYARTVLGMRGGAFVLTMGRISTATDVITLAIVSGENIRQLRAIEASSMSADEKLRLEAQVFAGWGLQTGLVALSVYGDVAAARQNPHLDVVDGAPVITPADTPAVHPGAADGTAPAGHADPASGTAEPGPGTAEGGPGRATAPAPGIHAGEGAPPTAAVHPGESAPPAAESLPGEGGPAPVSDDVGPDGTIVGPDSSAAAPTAEGRADSSADASADSSAGPTTAHPPAGAATPGTSAVDAAPPAGTAAAAPTAPPSPAAIQAARTRANAATRRLGSFSTPADRTAVQSLRDAVAASPEGRTPWGRQYLDYLDGKLAALDGHLAGTRAAPEAPLGSLRDYWMNRALFLEGSHFASYLDVLRARLPAGEADAALERVLAALFREGGPASVAALKARVRDELDQLLLRHLSIHGTTDPVEAAAMNQRLQDAMDGMDAGDRGRLGELWHDLRAQTEGVDTVGQVRVQGADVAAQGVTLAGNRRLDSVEVTAGRAEVPEAELALLPEAVQDAIGDAVVHEADALEVKSGSVGDYDQLRDHLRLANGNGGAGTVVQLPDGRWVRLRAASVELQRPGLLREDRGLLDFLQREYLNAEPGKSRVILFDGSRRIEVGSSRGGVDLLGAIDAAQRTP